MIMRNEIRIGCKLCQQELRLLCLFLIHENGCIHACGIKAFTSYTRVVCLVFWEVGDDTCRPAESLNEINF